MIKKNTEEVQENTGKRSGKRPPGDERMDGGGGGRVYTDKTNMKEITKCLPN